MNTKRIFTICQSLLLCLCCAFSAQAQPAVNAETVLAKVQAVDTYIREVRGYLHERPELSGQEYETAKFIQEELAKLGLPVTNVPGTGFYAVLDTHRPGKTVGLRADIDALPIPESPTNLKQQKKWVSQNKGVSHTCGHDGHIAILLGAAKILNELKDRLNGKIIFIFEEGEETGSGIDAMVEALKHFKIDAIYGNHLKSNLPTGQLFIREGAIMAGTGTVAFDVVGRGGHASRPDLSINPVFAAANILTGISIAWNNQRDITKTLTLGITQVQAGEVYNVIPNSAYIGGTIRFFDKEEAEKGFALFRKVSENIAQAHNCTVKFHSEMGIKLNPVINDPALTQFTREAMKEIYPGKIVSDDRYIWYAAESFSKYSQLAPTVFVFPGIKNETLGSGAEHHNDRFDLDEDALQYGVGAMVQFAVKYLK
ncbi:MAG: amidohydrolase [Tannerella sp.]|jgi:amidohydrolase|nr:amidohydrolase [Tannerella sp.]